MRKFLFFLICFVLSCSENKSYLKINSAKYVAEPKTNVNVFIHEGFTYQQVFGIFKAVNIWNKASNGNIIFKINFKEINDIKLVNQTKCNINMNFYSIKSSAEEVKVVDKQIKNTALGFAYYTKCNTAIIKLVTDRLNTDKEILWTSLHEIGHGIGLKHIDDKKTIMNPLFYENTFLCSSDTCCISKKDMIQVCEANNCNVEKTKYCF